MKFNSVAHLEERPVADAIVVPYVIQKGKPVSFLKASVFKEELKAALASGDFQGKLGEALWVYAETSREPRIVLLGLGDASHLTMECIRSAYGGLSKAFQSKKVARLNVFVPQGLKLADDEVARGLTEGLLLSNYRFAGLKSKADKREQLLDQVNFIGLTQAEVAEVKKYVHVCKGVYFARDLVNGNADDITPQHLSSLALQFAKEHPKIKTKIFDKNQLIKDKFGLILAVSRGSFRDPALIVMEYRGNPKSKEKFVLVGKGITYDTGGLNLKPTGSMETMRADMAGAAVVMATLQVAATLGLKQNLSVVIPAAENSISSKSYKPGDVYSGYAGQSVEIGNTDAEGRLVLADALAYAVKELKPTYLIDLATLTGAMDVALGSEIMGLFSNNDKLSSLLEKAGVRTYERVWRLPLVQEYREQLKSDVADLKNIGGKGAGSIKGALFLEAFIDKTPWAHLDIAAVAYASEIRKYLPKYGTGIGVRLLVEFLENYK